MAGLSLKNVVKKYPNGFVAIKEFNPEITDKKFIIFVGPSGCGKSTILRMIAGLEDTSSGELYIGDKLISDVEPKGRNVVMVFQNYALYPYMLIYDNMTFGPKLRRAPKDKIGKKVHGAARVLDLEYPLDRKPKVLSGGRRQRAAMGRAVVRSPKVFLMDEPLSNLDTKPRDQICIEISKPHQKLETTTVYVTHNQTRTIASGTKIVVTRSGIIRQMDNPQNLYNKPCNEFVTGFIETSQMNMIDATISKNGAPITLSLDGHIMALSEVKPKKLEDVRYTGKVVTLSICPEDLHDEESYLTMPSKNIFETIIHIYEMLGSETLLYFDIEDANFVVKINPYTTTGSGDTVKLAMGLEKIHVFDKDTELVVLS